MLQEQNLVFETLRRLDPRKDGRSGFEVTFEIGTSPTQSVIKIYVSADECAPSDVVRLAMHRLHLMMKQAADQTEHLRMDEAQIAALLR